MVKNLPGKSNSVWIATTPSTNYPQLEGSQNFDVAVIGGGISGITTAYFLSKKGLKVAVVEATRIITGTSGYTTAKITSLHGLIYQFLINNFGKEKAKIYADSNQWALKKITETINKERIDCDYQKDSAYTFTNDENKIEQIKNEFEAAHSLGLPASYEENIQTLPFLIKSAVKFSNQANFNPRKYLLGLAEKIIENNGSIFENSRVEKINENKLCSITTEKGEIKTKEVVIATNYPIREKGIFFPRLNQVRSYAYAIQTNNNNLQGMYLEIGGNNISIRPYSDDNNSWLIIGGESHLVGDKDNAFVHEAKLADIIKKLFKIKSFDYRWAAQDSSPIDKVPYIGKEGKSEHVYVITGFDEWGMTKSMLAAKIITDLISNKANEWSQFYNPSRINLKASLKKLKSTSKQIVKGFGKYLTTPSNEDFNQLTLNSGRVVKIKGKEMAVYKDKVGKLHTMSAVCTHMGCIVDWDNGSKTWACPCHGSRFDKYGKVIHGPAVKNLPKEKIEVK